MAFDPRGFEKAMKRAICPHFGPKAVCDACAQAQADAADMARRIEDDDREFKRKAADFEAVSLRQAAELLKLARGE